MIIRIVAMMAGIQVQQASFCCRCFCIGLLFVLF